MHASSRSVCKASPLRRCTGIKLSHNAAFLRCHSRSTRCLRRCIVISPRYTSNWLMNVVLSLLHNDSRSFLECCPDSSYFASPLLACNHPSILTSLQHDRTLRTRLPVLLPLCSSALLPHSFSEASVRYRSRLPILLRPDHPDTICAKPAHLLL